LHTAARSGDRDIDIVQILLQAAADVHAVDSAGQTPLEVALDTAALLPDRPDARCIHVAEMLLQAGAAVTAAVLAAAASLLAKQQQQQQQPAAFAGTPAGNLWRMLLAAAGSVDITDSEGRTALYIAAKNCRRV
jgi:ankyrin repeat protein